MHAHPFSRVFFAFAVFAGLTGFSLPLLAELAKGGGLNLVRINTDSAPDLKMYVNLIGEDGAVVGGHPAANFKLLYDGSELASGSAVTTFEKAKEPISVITIAQVSGSVGAATLTAVKAGFRQIGQAVAATRGGNLGVIAYSAGTKQLLAAGDAPAFEGALAKIKVDAAGKEVHLLDALQAAIELLNAQPTGRSKLIVVVSDGNDIRAERKYLAELGNRAQAVGIVIDTVGFNEREPDKLSNLKEISKRCYGSTRVAKSATDLGIQLGYVAKEIQNQYLVTFRLTAAPDDKEHSIQVTDESGSKPFYSNIVLMKLPAAAASKAPVH